MKAFGRDIDVINKFLHYAEVGEATSKDIGAPVVPVGKHLQMKTLMLETKL